jgi:hypothetical protein
MNNEQADKIVSETALRIVRTWRLSIGALPYIKNIIRAAIEKATAELQACIEVMTCEYQKPAAQPQRSKKVDWLTAAAGPADEDAASSEDDPESSWQDDSPSSRQGLVAQFILWFAKEIEHGDERHRKWLRDAARSFIDNGTIPPRPCPCEGSRDSGVTGEWTPDSVKKMRQKATDKQNNPLDGDKAIANAHNAALAAKEQWWSLALAEANELMNKQLAAERESGL